MNKIMTLLAKKHGQITIISSVVGLCLSIWLRYLHLHIDKVSETLAKVYTSDYSIFLGAPVAVLGILAYIVIMLARKNTKVVYFLSLIGFSIHAYLLHANITVIGHVCPYYTGSAVCMLLIFITSIAKLRHEQEKMWEPTAVGILLISSLIALNIGLFRNDVVLNGGKYDGYTANFTEDCGCYNTSDYLILTSPDGSEKHKFIDDVSNGEKFGSGYSDSYTHYIGKGEERYNMMGGYKENLPNVILRDHKEVMSIAAEDYEAVLDQMRGPYK